LPVIPSVPVILICYDLPLVVRLLDSLIFYCRFPNNFWGWGGEDDELGHRLELQVRSLAPPAVPRFAAGVSRNSTRLMLTVPVVGAASELYKQYHILHHPDRF